MKLRSLAAAACVLSLGAQAASATRFNVSGVFNHNVSGVFNNSGNRSFSGTIDVDIVAGIVTAADVVVSGYADFTSLGLQSKGIANSQTGYDLVLSTGLPQPQLQLTLLFTPVSLVGFTGGGTIFFARLVDSASIVELGFSGSITAQTAAAVPGPVVGAGIPGLILAFGGILAWLRRQSSKKSTPIS
jgi:hypothetical protein